MRRHAQGRLASAIPGGKREQHGSAVLGRQFDATEGEHELETQGCPGAGQPHGDRAAAHVGPIGESRKVDTLGLMAQ